MSEEISREEIAALLASGSEEMTTGVKGFGIEGMVIADTSKDKEPKVTTTCSDCHYNVYRMLGEEAQKLKEPDERGEHYHPFSQNGKIVQVVTYIQSAYRDGYKDGRKDGYKNGFDDGYREGKQDVELTEEQAIAFLQQSGWLENHDAECRANSNFDSEHFRAVLKDLYDSLESEDRA